MTDMSEATKLRTAEDMAVSYFTALVKEPTSVALAGYIDDCKRKEGGVDAFCDKLQSLLESLINAGDKKRVIVDHPLVDDDIDDSLFNLTSYSTFLTDAHARDPGEGVCGALRHGRYLAQRVLQDGLERLTQMQASEAAE